MRQNGYSGYYPPANEANEHFYRNTLAMIMPQTEKTNAVYCESIVLLLLT